MTRKIVVLGANGQVGTELLKVLSEQPQWHVVALTRAELDITDADAVKQVLSSITPDIVVNASAYTQVDKAESEPELAYAVNALGPKYLAEYTHSNNAVLLHISTDYVFSGEQSTPYLETDSPNPVSQYGVTKLQGERFIQSTCTQYLILRTAWVFGQTGNNFVKTMLRLAHSHPEISVVDDQMGTPTYAHDIARAIHVMLTKFINEHGPNKISLSGVYHFTGSPAVSWFEFAEAILHRYAGNVPSTPIINPINTAQYPTPAKRPAYSLLSNNKIQQVFDIMPSQWQLGLDQLLQDLTCK